MVTGWGATESYGVVSDRLMEVEVPILSNGQCRRSGYGARITDNMLCAGYDSGQKDACQVSGDAALPPAQR